MAGQTFEAKLIKDNDTNGAGIKITFDVQGAFGKKGRVPVQVTIDGHQFRGSIFPYGGIYYLGVRKEIRDAIGKTYGDTVRIVMEADDEPLAVKVPEDFAHALAGNEKAGQDFEKLSYSHKREYVEWIEDAKKEETRQRRIAKAIEKLTGN
jgi:hypothetical protein